MTGPTRRPPATTSPRPPPELRPNCWAGIQASTPRGAKELFGEGSWDSMPSVAPCGPRGPHRILRAPPADHLAQKATGQDRAVLKLG